MNVNPSFPVEANAPAQQSAVSQWLKKRRWFLLMVALPTLLAALYYGLIASDIFISESRFVIKSPDQKRSQISTLANLVRRQAWRQGMNRQVR